MRILVTRPEPDCQHTAALLRARGHEVLLLPMLRIEAMGQAHLGAGPWAAVLFTSANAVRAISAHRRIGELVRLPAYAVGGRTRAAAANAGFASVISADGDVDDLISLVAAQPPAANLPLLYLAGSDLTGDLAGSLQSHGFRVETTIVYRSVLVADLRSDVRAALADGRIDAVLHYSARTAAAFVAAVTAAKITDLSFRIRHLCLSAQVAAPLAEAGAKAIEVAREPNEHALFACLDRA
jgi:uroporphyrinogen-III synthase